MKITGVELKTPLGSFNLEEIPLEDLSAEDVENYCDHFTNALNGGYVCEDDKRTFIHGDGLGIVTKISGVWHGFGLGLLSNSYVKIYTR